MISVKNLLVCAALALPMTAVTSTANAGIFKPTQESVKTNRKKVVIDENTIIFRGEVDTSSVAKLMQKMYASKEDKVAIFIDSPGGSVVDGLHLFNFMANFNKPTICYVNFAASMAFAITQACTERYVMDSSVMMQHQAWFGGQASVNKMKEASRFGGNLSDAANALQAARLGMSVDDFATRTMNDWFMYGKEAVKENAADGIVFLECKPELTKTTYAEKVNVMFFTVDVTWSSCPLIMAPISVGMNSNIKAEDIAKIQRVLESRTEYMKELNGR